MESIQWIDISPCYFTPSWSVSSGLSGPMILCTMFPDYKLGFKYEFLVIYYSFMYTVHSMPVLIDGITHMVGGREDNN